MPESPDVTVQGQANISFFSASQRPVSARAIEVRRSFRSAAARSWLRAAEWQE